MIFPPDSSTQANTVLSSTGLSFTYVNSNDLTVYAIKSNVDSSLNNLTTQSKTHLTFSSSLKNVREPNHPTAIPLPGVYGDRACGTSEDEDRRGPDSRGAGPGRGLLAWASPDSHDARPLAGSGRGHRCRER